MAYNKSNETPFDEIRRVWSDTMIRRRIHLDYLHLADGVYEPWRDHLEDRINALEWILVDRGVPVRLDGRSNRNPMVRKTDLDRMLEIFDQFRPETT